LGAGALTAIRTAHLSKVFAILVLLAVALSVSGLRVRPTRPALFAGGGAAGVMGTMVGIHGPPMALVLQHARPDQARAMLGAFSNSNFDFSRGSRLSIDIDFAKVEISQAPRR
jgi:uncharacterized membrane protein YfcA